MKGAIGLTILLLAVAAAQSPPQITMPPQSPPQLFRHDNPTVVQGAVVAYDWSARSGLEGSRLEDFVLRVERVERGDAELKFVRVRLLWHPADQVKYLPDDFYQAGKRWQVTLRQNSPVGSFRDLCDKPVPTTVHAEVDGQKIELARYVDPAILPPEFGSWANARRSIELRPAAADVPNPRTLPCFLLDTRFVVESADGRTGWMLRPDGIGVVRVGMTLSQVNAVLGQNFSTPSGEDEQACFYVEPKQHPDTAIMVLDGRVARVDVFAPDNGSPSTATAEGIHIGDSEARVKDVYGDKAAVSPHRYTEGHYLTVQSGNNGLRFETEQEKITGFYAGTLRAIALVEGCW